MGDLERSRTRESALNRPREAKRRAGLPQNICGPLHFYETRSAACKIDTLNINTHFKSRDPLRVSVSLRGFVAAITAARWSLDMATCAGRAQCKSQHSHPHVEALAARQPLHKRLVSTQGCTDGGIAGPQDPGLAIGRHLTGHARPPRQQQRCTPNKRSTPRSAACRATRNSSAHLESNRGSCRRPGPPCRQPPEDSHHDEA